MKGKKGITPIVAIGLLLVLTIAAAGTAFFWLTQLQGQIQEDQEQFEVLKFANTDADIEVLAADYNPLKDSLTVFLKNAGKIEIPVKTDPEPPTTVWLLRDPISEIICSTDWSGSNNGPECLEGCDKSQIDKDATRKLTLGGFGTGSLCDISEQEEGGLMSFKIDFSGETTTRGSFIR